VVQIRDHGRGLRANARIQVKAVRLPNESREGLKARALGRRKQGVREDQQLPQEDLREGIKSDGTKLQTER
jgi:hypothetical protein